MFRERSVYYESDLMWMGPVAFRYYLGAVVQFIRSEASKDDSDFIAHFCGTLEFRLEHEPQELHAAVENLGTLCTYVVEHWSKFEAGADAYGDVQDRFAALRAVFLRMKAEPGR